MLRQALLFVNLFSKLGILLQNSLYGDRPFVILDEEICLVCKIRCTEVAGETGNYQVDLLKVAQKYRCVFMSNMELKEPCNSGSI